MIDTAGTLCAGGGALVDRGATRVYACATHAVFSGPALENIEERVRAGRGHRHHPGRPRRAARQGSGCCRSRRSWLIRSPTSSTTIRSPGCSTAGTSSSSEARKEHRWTSETRGASREGRGGKDARAMRLAGEIPAWSTAAGRGDRADRGRRARVAPRCPAAAASTASWTSRSRARSPPGPRSSRSYSSTRCATGPSCRLPAGAPRPRIQTVVALHLEGTPEGVKTGGVLSQPTHQINI